MTWYVLVLVTQMQQGLHEGFLWTDPKFTNKEECLYWAENNPVEVIQTLNYYYPKGWQMHDFVCIREDKLKDHGVRPMIDQGDRI